MTVTQPTTLVAGASLPAPAADRRRRTAPAVTGKGRAFALYFALTLVLAFPMSCDPGGSVAGGGPDVDLFMWTLAWNAHALVSRPLSIFEANIYHPQSLTLAYSENLIGSALVAAPVLWLSGNPILAMNAVALLSAMLCGLGGYLLGRRVGLQGAGAVLCGLVFAFSPPRFLRIGQIHLTTIQWVPFALASLHAYLDGGRRRDLRLAAGFFTLQALTSGHGAVLLIVGAACIVAYRMLAGEPLDIRRRLGDLGIPGALLLLPAVLITVPYRFVQTELGLRRALENWAITPESFLASPARFQVWLLSLFPDARIMENAHAYLFPGWLPILLAAVALVGLLRFRVPGRRTGVRPITPWTRLAFVLSLVALASLSVAIVVALNGRIRLRAGDTLLFSARDSFRAWMVCALCVGARAVLARRAPFALADRGRRSWRTFLSWRASRPWDARIAYAIVTVGSIGLAIGPPLSLWPLVYWLPGMNFIRVPSRFMLLAVLGLAVLAGFGFERLRSRLAPRAQPALAVIVGMLLLAEFVAVPLDAVPHRVDIPAVDRWLALQPKPFVIVELPMLNQEALQTTYMLHSMAHWQKTVNGYSGLRPPLHRELFSRLRGFPDDFTVQSLAALGVNYVAIHTDLYPPGEWADVEARLKRHPELRLAYAAGSGLIYVLEPDAGAVGN